MQIFFGSFHAHWIARVLLPLPFFFSVLVSIVSGIGNFVSADWEELGDTLGVEECEFVVWDLDMEKSEYLEVLATAN